MGGQNIVKHLMDGVGGIFKNTQPKNISKSKSTLPPGTHGPIPEEGIPWAAQQSGNKYKPGSRANININKKRATGLGLAAIFGGSAVNSSLQSGGSKQDDDFKPTTIGEFIGGPGGVKIGSPPDKQITPDSQIDGSDVPYEEWSKPDSEWSNQANKPFNLAEPREVSADHPGMEDLADSGNYNISDTPATGNYNIYDTSVGSDKTLKSVHGRGPVPLGKEALAYYENLEKKTGKAIITEPHTKYGGPSNIQLGAVMQHIKQQKMNEAYLKKMHPDKPQSFYNQFDTGMTDFRNIYFGDGPKSSDPHATKFSVSKDIKAMGGTGNMWIRSQSLTSGVDTKEIIKSQFKQQHQNRIENSIQKKWHSMLTSGGTSPNMAFMKIQKQINKSNLTTSQKQALLKEYKLKKEQYKSTLNIGNSNKGPKYTGEITGPTLGVTSWGGWDPSKINKRGNNPLIDPFSSV